MTHGPDPVALAASVFGRGAGEASCFIFRGHQLLVSAAGGLPAAARQQLGALPPLRMLEFLGPAGEPCLVAEFEREREPPPGHRFEHLKALLDTLPTATRSAAARALELLEFDRTHRFCGSCGAPTALATQPIARRCTNPDCGREHYPRVSPVVIVAVERGDEILLGRSPHFPPGLYSTLAGFVDAGESAEQAVHREIHEETRLQVRNLRYFASQPWPFPHSLMLGYQAEYAGGDIVCAPDEIEDARFFHVDALPPVFPMRSAMANELPRDPCRRHGRPWPPTD